MDLFPNRLGFDNILIIDIKISLLYIHKEWQGRFQCLIEIWQNCFSLNFSVENQGSPDLRGREKGGPEESLCMCVYVVCVEVNKGEVRY